ncbi:GNAT family N-acetyltransferase [Streptomyces sp. NPDC060194]|uniref:GNAT family N-acetyltransferase n=1 Tax=Streptomyces sp. NPDC060194 TaxID=3347069 RepID=UPI003647EBC9
MIDDTDDAPERNVAWPAGAVGLAPVDLADAELLHGWLSDPVALHEFGSWPRSLTALTGRIERDMDDEDRDDFLVLLPDGTPAGFVALSGQDLAGGTAAVELLLAPEHRGHGHGGAALDALVDLAFGELPLHRLTAETHTGNRPALAVLTRSGFLREGTSRQACLHRGRRHDLARFALLRPEWDALTRPRAWDA